MIVFLRKIHLLRCLGLSSSPKLDWGSCIAKKIGALIHVMKFLSPEVALYLYKSTIQPYMQYCCPVWLVLPVAAT